MATLPSAGQTCSFNTILQSFGGYSPASFASVSSAAFASNAVGSFSTSNAVGVAFPPASLTSNSCTLSGLSYGNGSYVVTSSSAQSAAFNVFSTTNASNWTSGAGLYNSSYNYLGSNYFNNIAVGEWVQLQLPLSIAVSSITLTSAATGSVSDTISRFVLCASSNATNWLLISSGLFVPSAPSLSQTFVVSNTGGALYSYYTLIAFNGGAATGAVRIGSVSLSTPSTGTVGVGGTPTGRYGLELVTSPTLIATTSAGGALGVRGPVTLLGTPNTAGTLAAYLACTSNSIVATEAADLTRVGDSNKFSVWKQFAQASNLLQPTYYATGGNYNTVFGTPGSAVLFNSNSSVYLTSNVTANIATNGGFSVVVGARVDAVPNTCTIFRLQGSPGVLLELFFFGGSPATYLAVGLQTQVSGSKFYPSAQLAIGTWNTYGIRYSLATGTVTLTFNGVTVGSGTITAPANQSILTTTTIGSGSSANLIGAVNMFYVWDSYVPDTQWAAVLSYAAGGLSGVSKTATSLTVGGVGVAVTGGLTVDSMTLGAGFLAGVNGYTILPGGIMLSWGQTVLTIANTTQGQTSVAYARAYSSAPWVVTVSLSDPAPSISSLIPVCVVGAFGMGTTTFTLTFKTNSSTTATYTANWHVIGPA